MKSKNHVRSVHTISILSDPIHVEKKTVDEFEEGKVFTLTKYMNGKKAW